MEENNRLIAEFMGLESPDRVYFEYLTKDGHRSKLTHYMLLKYHLEWDWLMPAAIKCVNINLNEFIIFSKSGFKNVMNSDFEITSDPINFLYEEVVEFIKWYNKNK